MYTQNVDDEIWFERIREAAEEAYESGKPKWIPFDGEIEHCPQKDGEYFVTIRAKVPYVTIAYFNVAHCLWFVKDQNDVMAWTEKIEPFKEH